MAEIISADGIAEERACRLLNLYLPLLEPTRDAFATMLESKYKYVVLFFHEMSGSRQVRRFFG